MKTLPTRLHRRPENGIYYCRVAVPHDLVSVIEKREIKVSLKTSNLREAIGRYSGETEFGQVDLKLVEKKLTELISANIDSIKAYGITNKLLHYDLSKIAKLYT